MRIPASWHPPGTTTHVVCDDTTVTAALFAAMAGDFMFTTNTIGGIIQIRTSDPDRFRDMLRVWAYRSKVEIEEDFPGSFVRVGQDSRFNPAYHKIGCVIVTDLDSPMPDDPETLVLALGEVTRGQFTGSIVTSAPATEGSPTWLIGPPTGLGRRSIVASAVNRADIFTANVRRAEVRFPEPVFGTYQIEAMVVMQPTTTSGDRAKLNEEQKIDLYRKVTAIRLYIASGFRWDHGRHHKEYPIPKLIGPLEGKAWPSTREIHDLFHEFPAYLNKLSDRIPSVNGILKSAKMLGMVGKWTPVNSHVRLKLERDSALGRGRMMKLVIERRPGKTPAA